LQGCAEKYTSDFSRILEKFAGGRLHGLQANRGHHGWPWGLKLVKGRIKLKLPSVGKRLIKEFSSSMGSSGGERV